jgi:hypothetical protein
MNRKGVSTVLAGKARSFSRPCCSRDHRLQPSLHGATERLHDEMLHNSLSRHAFIGGTLAGILLPTAAVVRNENNVINKDKADKVMQIQCAFETQHFIATLDDNPTARDLMSMLPLDLTIEDYSTNEKIARLPRKLIEDGSGPFSNEAPGDLAYYAPWGNLAFFHSNYRYSKGLIRIGRLDDAVRPLLTRGTFPLHIDLVP